MNHKNRFELEVFASDHPFVHQIDYDVNRDIHTAHLKEDLGGPMDFWVAKDKDFKQELLANFERQIVAFHRRHNDTKKTNLAQTLLNEAR